VRFRLFVVLAEVESISAVIFWRKAPLFVIPESRNPFPLRHSRESGNPFCFSSSVLAAAAKTDSRSCAFRRPSVVAGYFLLLAQKKVTKEKGTLAVAVTRASVPA
jgi:hypothetical protein